MSADQQSPTRLDVLRDLVELRSAPEAAAQALTAFAWDSDQVLIHLSRTHVATLLRAFIRRDLTPHEVEVWAEAVECRDDIGRQPGQEDLLQDFLFDAANPDLQGHMDHDIARAWLGRMDFASISDAVNEHDQVVIRGCVQAATEGPFFDDDEFDTLLGLTRREVAQVLEEWPHDTSGHQQLAINGALGNLLGYPHGMTDRLPTWTGLREGELQAVYARWRAAQPPGWNNTPPQT